MTTSEYAEIMKSIRELKDIVTPLEGAINTVNHKISSLETKDKEIIETLSKHNNALYGNGKKGVLTEISLLKERFNTLKESVKSDIQLALSGIKCDLNPVSSTYNTIKEYVLKTLILGGLTAALLGLIKKG
ncbi:hypothetical protein Dip510_000820 [Elusimicrobium posterum]|uniref:hypothetical protein n=1 Tax=Elusimicrobium posterum TaxID=3116653 RepID=UPI003C7434A1